MDIELKKITIEVKKNKTYDVSIDYSEYSEDFVEDNIYSVIIEILGRVKNSKIVNSNFNRIYKDDRKKLCNIVKKSFKDTEEELKNILENYR